MKAVIIDSFGHEDQMKLREVPDPQPAASEIIVATAYASVNPVDWKIRKGMLRGRLPHQFPLILGWDVAGTVRTVGQNVSRFKPGDRVYACCRKPTIQWGSYAELVAVEESAVALIPSNLPFREAAGIPLVGLTAWQCFYGEGSAQLKAGETVLIFAGSGGVGGMAIQFAKWTGAKVITTASSKNESYVRSLGADVVIDSHKPHLVEEIQRLAPQGVDVVLDALGGTVQMDGFRVLKKGGRLISIIHPPVAETDAEDPARKGKQGLYHFVNSNGAQLAEIAQLIEKGKIHPLPTEELPLEQVAQAHLRSEEGHVRGKLVLKVS